MSSRFSSSCLPPDLQQHRYLTEKEVSALTGRAVQSLRNDRHLRRGFRYVKYRGSIRYRLQDIIAEMDSCLIETEAICVNGKAIWDQ